MITMVSGVSSTNRQAFLTCAEEFVWRPLLKMPSVSAFPLLVMCFCCLFFVVVSGLEWRVLHVTPCVVQYSLPKS